MTYTETVNISKAEWIVIQQLRAIVSHKFGTLTVKVDSGKIVDVLPQASVLKDLLREAQA